jgi:predicted transcriptional regulator
MAPNVINNTRIGNSVSVVAGYVSNNAVPVGEMPQLIERVFATLTGLGIEVPVEPEMPKPVVPIKNSIRPDYIICLEDGKRMKMLKRHLRVAYNMSPEEYRQRWGLPATYPMVAPNYSKQRSKLAKEFGLGSSRRRRR